MKKSKIIFFALLIAVGVNAQQDPMYSQYWINATILNPAQVAADGYTTLNLTGRYQWINVDGAPKTTSVSFSGMPVNKLGIGGSYIYDEIGPVRSHTLNADFAYHLKISHTWTVTIGTRVSLMNTAVNLTDLYIDQQGDPGFVQNLNTGLKPNAGFGLLLHNEHFYIGYAEPRTVDYNLSSSEFMNVKIMTNRFLYSGYNFTLNEEVNLRPSVLLKQVNNTLTQFDFNLVAEFNSRLSTGLSYRTGDGIGAMIGIVPAEKFKIYYCYDYPLSPISQISKQTHQLSLIYTFSKKDKRIDSPRYFE
ncbi:MAG: type IX secretion system membrane protein PorP/SprF [Bacteroidia bacterium]